MNTEHFVTLFDEAFLPLGLAMHATLMRHAQPFTLWVVCMDDGCLAALRRLAPTNVVPIPLSEVETANPRLLAVRPGRSRGEYCWTITAFTFDAVFRRDPRAGRVTYLDADLGFQQDPRIILNELTGTGKGVLITEHGFAPAYAAKAKACGRFCVQFLTVARRADALSVIAWWQDRVIEWCFAREEPTRFGDQKYLDVWPQRFGDTVHILADPRLTLAPWNVRHVLGHGDDPRRHVLYHFHDLRMASRHRVRLFWRYPVGSSARTIYSRHAEFIAQACADIESAGLVVRWPGVPRMHTPRDVIRAIWFRITGRIAWVNLP
jgi:hypothetical protein